MTDPADTYEALATAPQPPVEAQARPVEWVQEWQGSGPQRGYHIREATRLHNNRVVAYLGDQVDSGEVDRLIAEHNGKHPNGDPVRTEPTPAEAQARPAKPAECADGCPPQQVCDHCQWPPGQDAEAQAQGGGEVDPLLATAVRNLRSYLSKASFSSMVDKRAAENCVEVLASAATAHPSAPVGVEGLMQLARNWCLAWGEWAHDADPGCAKENAAEAALRAALTTALVQQPAAVDGVCVDWRAMYRFQTAMRYMDNNPNLSKQKADRMADDNVAGLESANATQS